MWGRLIRFWVREHSGRLLQIHLPINLPRVPAKLYHKALGRSVSFPGLYAITRFRGVDGETMSRKLIGRYILTDPQICHGKPTFRGTRIMVSQVLHQVANGMAWETIVDEWGAK